MDKLIHMAKWLYIWVLQLHYLCSHQALLPRAEKTVSIETESVSYIHTLEVCCENLMLLPLVHFLDPVSTQMLVVIVMQSDELGAPSLNKGHSFPGFPILICKISVIIVLDLLYIQTVRVFCDHNYS